MRPQIAMLGLIALLLASCGPPERPPPPYFAIPKGPPPVANAAVPEGAPGVAPVIVPNPSVQYFLPSHPEDLGRGPEPVPRPAAASPFYSAPINPGPITGYGPGGMAQPPGAPLNPPYPAGGLTGIR